MAEQEKPVSTSDAVSSPTGQQNTGAQGELTTAVNELLDQLEHKFDSVSREMFSKLDDMARRLDELDASLQSEGGAGPASPTK